MTNDNNNNNNNNNNNTGDANLETSQTIISVKLRFLPDIKNRLQRHLERQYGYENDTEYLVTYNKIL